MKIKNINMILKIITMMITSFLLISTTYAYEVKEVKVQDDKTMEVSLDDNVQLSQGEITGDIKVLKDIGISMSSKDFNELNKVLITLDNDLVANSSYSLLSIFGADGSIDFEIGEDFSGVELNNPEKIKISEQGIVKVIVIDSKNLEVYFNDDLEGEEFEFKLLKEVAVDSLSSLGENKVIIKSSDSLEVSTDYMLVIVSLSDTSGIELEFNEDIFDFSTNDDLVITKVESGNIDILNSAPEDIKKDENFIDNVAANVTETPDTGSETWVLIFGTLLINSFYYFSRKKRIKA